MPGSMIAENSIPHVIARSVKEAKHIVLSKGFPVMISFDHDLGDGENGYDFAKWIIDLILDGKYGLPENFSYYVHSMNPIGKKNIEELMHNFLLFWYKYNSLR